MKKTNHFILNFMFILELFLGLSDLLAPFERPHACDLKMGTVTYFPDTPIEQQSRDDAKYIWRSKLGMIISGMQVSFCLFLLYFCLFIVIFLIFLNYLFYSMINNN